jgi:hypothetical protein
MYIGGFRYSKPWRFELSGSQYSPKEGVLEGNGEIAVELRSTPSDGTNNANRNPAKPAVLEAGGSISR